MAQRSHVPKFGNWEGGNVPYTAYFDTAIKEKVGGGLINPNDPAQNPEAFKFGRLENGIDSTDTDSHSNQISGPASLEKSASSEQYHADGEGHRRHYAHRRTSSESDRTTNSTVSTQKSITSDTSSDYSVLDIPNHQHGRSDRQKVTTESSHNGFLATPIGSNKLRATSNPTDDLSFTSASVPKFGAWDERNSKSGEGFTVTINEVKEEKQIAGAKFSPTQQQASNTAANQSKKSKRYCCY